MYAHYFSSRARKELVITSSPSLNAIYVVSRQDVSGKAEARKLAAKCAAKCWNF